MANVIIKGATPDVILELDRKRYQIINTNLSLDRLQPKSIRVLYQSVQKLAYKKDWSRESLPVRNDLQRLVDNIAALCDSFYAMATS